MEPDLVLVSQIEILGILLRTGKGAFNCSCVYDILLETCFLTGSER